MNKLKGLAAAVFALVLAAACGSSGNIGDIFGTGNQGTYTVHGTVDSVDTSNHSILLTNADYTTGLNPGGNTGTTVRVYYDSNTTVSYQSRNYRPEDLERGDQVTISATQSGNQLIAQSMDVTYNARGSMASSYPYPSNSVLHGTVRSIDTYNRTLTLDPGTGSYVTVSYDTTTPVYYNGQTYYASNLQVGDQVDIRTNNLGSGRLGAQDITVTRSISSGSTGSSSYPVSTIQGTVRYVDASTRTITVDNSQWMAGFQTNAGNTMTIRYDANAQVNYQGRLYPVTNLQPGDVIQIQVQNLGGANYLAQSMTVIRDVNAR